MEPESPQDRVLRHYTIEPQSPLHRHDYRYVGGEHTVRYCTSCEKSWALVELESLIDHRTIYVWRETEEENEI
jgi:hypothetical protein